MRTTNRRLALVAVMGLSALALPASASAHPGVLEVMAEVAPCTPTNTTDPANCTDQRQYAVLNDGITQVWRESNGLNGKGLVNYKKFPSAVRTNIGPDKTQWLIPSTITDLQIHATCTGVAALETPASIVSWQNDPFYDYIPFQKDSANFGDDPAKWIPVVKTQTGVDLETNPNLANACTDLGGTLVPADALVTNATQASSATIAAAVNTATGPLNTQIGTLNAQVGGLTASLGELNAQLIAAQNAKNASDATAASLRAQLTAARAGMTVKVVTSSLKRGATVDVTGPPLAAVTVRLGTTKVKAKELGLASNILGTATKALGADGKLRIAVSFSKATIKALKGFKGTLPGIVDAVSAASAKGVSVSLKR